MYLWSDFKARAMVDWWTGRRPPGSFRRPQRRDCGSRPPVVRRDVAGVRVARAAAWLSDAERLLDKPPDAFVAATKDRDLAIFYLFLAIQECIDFAAHWVADAGWGAPDDAGSTFEVLAQRGAIDRMMAGTLHTATGLRNRIAHGYAMLYYQRVQREAQADIPALRAFLEAVTREAGL